MASRFLFLPMIVIAGLTAATAQRTSGGGTAPPWSRDAELLRAGESVIPPAAVDSHAPYNAEAPIPPQCYTRTDGRHNPCYVCHQDAVPGRENTMNDGRLQAEYDFSALGAVNHWRNLFEDRRASVARISDAQIRAWTAQDNYSELPARLRAARFTGWIPDLAGLETGAAAFDAEGLARDGSHWMAINYKPFPSTFWPTNGSSDDVMIRLPPAFRQDAGGRESRDVYFANLALLELSIKGMERVDIFPVDENRTGVDLDGDGRMDRATQVIARDHFVGGAADVAVEPTVYPQGTEFLHTVRYLEAGVDGSVGGSRRMKEVRYMRRYAQGTRAELRKSYAAEAAESETGEPPEYRDLGQQGLATEMGWQLSGFIEDRGGRLRANTREEQMYCMGCHDSIGATIDKTFSFARKRDGIAGWRYVDLRGMPDAPNRGETRGEIATYLERVGGGSEFRSNPEMERRWYLPDGRVNHAALERAPDVYALIAPSPQRALLLDKAYRVIVAEQSFLFGRDATVEPPANVYPSVDAATAPRLPADRQYRWDLRLAWQ